MNATRTKQDLARKTPGLIQQLFATPLARITCPLADELNPRLAEIALQRAAAVENKIVGKSETSADLTHWGEPSVDGITQWMLKMSRQFVETLTGSDLGAAYATCLASEAASFNGKENIHQTPITIVPGHSWASVYRNGDSHEAHFHPNTALTAIYYVTAPSVCELDLFDPRANVEYFNPGIVLAGEGQRVRLRCAPGELVLFPGWLRHAVPPFADDAVRISMSWNLGYGRVRQ
ncbi:TIGR02466 family protein [Amycolatopsis sp. WGS_07]|uniref:TIGR02466 family protein n=1 Tax=Amycolatopsis sp. WGS_07 TaxID=3076764 RepID=UPI0038734802